MPLLTPLEGRVVETVFTKLSPPPETQEPGIPQASPTLRPPPPKRSCWTSISGLLLRTKHLVCPEDAHTRRSRTRGESGTKDDATDYDRSDSASRYFGLRMGITS